LLGASTAQLEKFNNHLAESLNKFSNIEKFITEENGLFVFELLPRPPALTFSRERAVQKKVDVNVTPAHDPVAPKPGSGAGA
jgi:hypothetical protein